MGCFTIGFIEQLLVNLVIIAAIVACIKLLVPWVVSMTGWPIIGQVIMIILWAIVAIFVIYLIFGLLSCLVGTGGFHPGTFQR